MEQGDLRVLFSVCLTLNIGLFDGSRHGRLFTSIGGWKRHELSRACWCMHFPCCVLMPYVTMATLYIMTIALTSANTPELPNYTLPPDLQA